ncbi:hypothetical protein FA10DRAFT_172292 [Acaromyces ingoldii]|uniref:Uncharacterized protein n=1 Tax=Acaromyces ingoldii TaxID=215250 RepID=A0A316YI48_9BASI|nr:hypothetical protein FA10DRAFT_172292 [Acaromyces ingoldii]PWN88746.1 hypothetical protein FA10DRAFT_172292 [Acaromyces ingoldii]
MSGIGALLTSPVAGIYDGLRYSRSSKWNVAASYEGLDSLHAQTRFTVGTMPVSEGSTASYMSLAKEKYSASKLTNTHSLCGKARCGKVGCDTACTL